MDRFNMNPEKQIASHEKKQQAFEIELKNLESVTDSQGTHIEQGVIQECAYLNCLHMYTRQSCEGHVERDQLYPWIDFSSVRNPELKDAFDEVQTRKDALIDKIQHAAIQESGVIDLDRKDKSIQQQFSELDLETQKRLLDLVNAHKNTFELRVYRTKLQILGVTFPEDITDAELLREWCFQNLDDEQSKQLADVKIPEDVEDSYTMNIDYYDSILVSKAKELDRNDLTPRLAELFKEYTPDDAEFGYVLYQYGLQSTPDLIPKKIADMIEEVGYEGVSEFEKKLLQAEKEEFLARSRKAFAHFGEYLKEYYYKDVL